MKARALAAGVGAALGGFGYAAPFEATAVLCALLAGVIVTVAADRWINGGSTHDK